MANAYQIKGDVVNELRNKLYYNQLDVQRLLNNPPGLSHREIVNGIVEYLRQNVEATQSIELLESYIPTQQPQAAPASQPAPSVEDDGVKKVN